MSTSRRQFIKDSSVAAMAGTAIFAATNQPREKQMKNLFIHHVYFFMKDPGNAADVAKLVEGLNKLSKVKLIKNFHIGKAAGTPRDLVDISYGASWFAVFDNAADQTIYQTDPIHLKFVEDYSHLWQKVIVYDTIDA
jgi:hypothetical protein